MGIELPSAEGVYGFDTLFILTTTFRLMSVTKRYHKRGGRY